MRYPPTVLTRLLAFSLNFVWLSVGLSAADPIFIADLEREKEAYLGKNIRVEGRLQFIDPFKFKLRNSSVLFESQDELKSFAVKPQNLDISGQLHQDGKNYIFRVTSIDSMNSDADQLRRRRNTLDRDNPRQHYDLAAWARKRGEFYLDNQLKSEAQELTQQAFRLEWTQLGPDDFDGRLALAKKGSELVVPEEWREELLHQAYRIRIRNLQKTPQPNWLEIVAEIARDFPGAEASLPDTPELQKRREEYLRSPDSVYKAADHAGRLELHRVLWGEVKRLEFLELARLEPAQGVKYADELEKLLPEYRSDAEKLRNDLLMQRSEQFEKMTRRELVEFRDELIQRQKPEDAERIVTEWLEFRRKQLKQDDLEGLIQLASDFEALGRSGAALAPALIAAAVAYPDSREITAALEKLGYRLINGQWQSTEERERHANSPHQKELKEGLVAIGMTAAEVRKSQGVPASLTRISSNGELREIWAYGRPGDQGGFTVYLRRKRLDPQAIVFAINDLKTK